MTIDEQIYLLLSIPAAIALVCGFALAKLHSRLYPSKTGPKPATDHASCATLYRDFQPGAGPMIGRRVLDNTGRVWVRQPGGSMQVTEWLLPAQGVGSANVIAPDQLATLAGPLVLLPLTGAEREKDALYGPSNGRWGTPDDPCPYGACKLGFGHTGPHSGRDGFILPFPGMTVSEGERGAGGWIDPAKPDPTDGACNCGRPNQHRPTCPRYRKMTGGTHDGNRV